MFKLEPIYLLIIIAFIYFLFPRMERFDEKTFDETTFDEKTWDDKSTLCRVACQYNLGFMFPPCTLPC